MFLRRENVSAQQRFMVLNAIASVMQSSRLVHMERVFMGPVEICAIYMMIKVLRVITMLFACVTLAILDNTVIIVITVIRSLRVRMEESVIRMTG